MFFGIPLTIARNRALNWTSNFSISSFLFVDRLSVVYAFNIFFCFLSIWFYCVT